MTIVEAHLLDASLVDLLSQDLTGVAPGHCMRLDDIQRDDAHRMVGLLRDRLPDADVHVLERSPSAPAAIDADRAVELRNRKRRALLLLVPAGEGHAASSLDNSFERLPLMALLARAATLLERGLWQTDVAEHIRLLRRLVVRRAGTASWARFLAVLSEDPREENLGRNLWQLGLVPDHGPDPYARLPYNVAAAGEIAHARRPTASVSERLVDAGLRDSELRLQLRVFLEGKASPLSDVQRWTRILGQDHADQLTFERWPLVDTVESEMNSVAIVPFLSADNDLDKGSRLRYGGDGQLVCQVPDDGQGSVVVKWATDPPKTEAVAKWLLEVVPPADARLEGTSPLGSGKVAGGKRRATVSLSVNEDDLASGSRFVVRLQALDENGDRVLLSAGDFAEVDSQEFEVVLVDNEVTGTTRKASAASLPEAVLRAAVEGLDDHAEDLVTWDLTGQVFSVRLGNRRVSQIRVSDVLVALQRRLLSAPHSAVALTGDVNPGSRLDPRGVASEALELPRALSERRSRVLQALAARTPRDVAEAISWDDELRELVSAYVGSYRRALDAADTADVHPLLTMDTLTVRARTVAGPVTGVVLLPTHPLRLAWLRGHDAVLRGWAAALSELPRAGRASTVDIAMATRITPANLPFTVLASTGTAMVYNAELTHGSALYLPAAGTAAESAADTICAALGIARDVAGLGSMSSMLRERIAAFRAAHPGGAALRVLALNPGSGELLARAVQPMLSGGDDDVVEGQRLEVLAYTDQASYTEPLAPLQDLQRSMRLVSRATRGSHLSPPVALAVRPSAAAMDDEGGAHVAVVQNLPSGDIGLMRSPRSRGTSFRDLLVPTTTHAEERDGQLVWRTVPALHSRLGQDRGELSVTHRSHQSAMARHLGDPEGTPSVDVSLDGDRLAQLRSLHERADWVLTVDRYLGLNLYEDPVSSGLGSAYLLDYAPDFVEGLGDRLTVTTAHRAEVERLLASGMRELGLAAVGSSVGSLLATLSVVSGRLALRLFGESNLAREAVSLGALVMHLRERSELDDMIVIPVDAHPEIFAPAARDGERARRCDVLLVKVGQRSFRIDCIEVKSRQEALLPEALADRIAEQLLDTEKLITSRFFATDPPRVDGELQRARLANLLHYYADRSALHGLIDEARLMDVHRYIDRIEEQKENPEITMRGYVIALGGDEGFPRLHRGIPMTVLTDQELGRIGFTTQLEVLRREHPADVEAASSGTDSKARTDPEVNVGKQPSATVAGTTSSAATDLSAGGVSDSPIAVGEDSVGDAAPRVSVPLNRVSGATKDQAVAESTDDGAGVDGSDTDARSARALGAGTIWPVPSAAVVLGTDGAGRPATWQISTKGSPHAFIIGIPGQGKSVSTRKIIRDLASQGLPSLVFDFHGDMAADPPAGSSVVDASEGLPFNPLEPRVGVAQAANNAAWEIAEIMAYVCGLGEIQRNHVYRALQTCYASTGWSGTEAGATIPTMSDFAAELERVEAEARGRNARDRLRPLTDFGLFRDGVEGVFDPSSGGGMIVDVSGLGLEQVQLAAGAFLLRKVYRDMFRWEEGLGMRLAVVLDEAHRLAKDVTLPKLMKEGRKYGVSVVVASQGLEDFRRQVLENAGTKIVFRTNFPASKTVAGYLRGRAGQDLSQQIEQLGVGQAYVSTPDEVQARKIYMEP